MKTATITPTMSKIELALIAHRAGALWEHVTRLDDPLLTRAAMSLCQQLQSSGELLASAHGVTLADITPAGGTNKPPKSSSS